MGLSFIGIAFGILAIIGIAVLVYFCCCRKKQAAETSPPFEPAPAPIYQPADGVQPPPPPGTGPVGWNVSQPPGVSGPGAPYPTGPMPGGPVGSAWGQAQAPYPSAPGAPPSYPSAPPPYPG